jgi:hypothetical protein
MPDVEPATPAWLAMARHGSRLPIREILDGCTYYPASGTDGEVFAKAWQWAPSHSFVLVDYSVSRSRLVTELRRPIDRGGQGLLGYRLAFHRPVAQEELGVPPTWRSSLLTAEEAERAHNRALGGLQFGRVEKPYCEWAVFDREDGRSATHGPERLSLLYLCADGVAAYEALFGTHRVAPKTLVIKQPGTGFGGNWTNFFAEGEPLHRAVASLGRRFGLWPAHLMFGGMGSADSYREDIWAGYEVMAMSERPGSSLLFASRQGG